MAKMKKPSGLTPSAVSKHNRKALRLRKANYKKRRASKIKQLKEKKKNNN